MLLHYDPPNANLAYRPTTEPYFYEKKFEGYAAPLLNLVINKHKVETIADNDRFSFSGVLINMVKDGLEGSEIDFARLKLRFTDVIFNSLSLLDDYIQEENKEMAFFPISDEKFVINHIFSDMILSSIAIHPSRWHAVGTILIDELTNNLKRYGNVKLQTGYLALIDNEVRIIRETTRNIKEVPKSNAEFLEL